MEEISPSQVSIRDSFWSPRLLTNGRVAIFHQWRQLEESRCIDNFRIAAGLKEGFREGLFFADSDAYKWLDAAAKIYAGWPSEDLRSPMDEFISLLARAQMEDGYLYTYNQIHFPGSRWENLMIEHELYCLGHLIEAAVSHYQATNTPSALRIGQKAADLLVRDFLSAPADKTSGHEEIEIALLRLFGVTGNKAYVDLAKQFLERRGKVHPFAPLILQQNSRTDQRSAYVRKQRQAYLTQHPELGSFQPQPDNYALRPTSAKIRFVLSGLNGKFQQQHAPIRSQSVPVGHAVRFGYLETAVAMLHRIEPDPTLLPAMEKAWERMVTRRMYVTGGVGSLPEIEGFGRDDELDPEIAYAETCAALASLFWNWEMALITADAKYSDLLEWQLYNAAGVGMGLGGDSYLYNNPLLCRGGIFRRPWFLVPCCPSNLSRTWASLGKYICSLDQNELWIHQYIGNEMTMESAACKGLAMESSLPWEGTVSITLRLERPSDFTLHLRIPAWAQNPSIQINGSSTPVPERSRPGLAPTACGYDPRLSRFFSVRRRWSPDDHFRLELGMPVLLRNASPRVRGHRNRVALSRGPLVYCLESVDNPGIDIFHSRIDPGSIRVERDRTLLGGVQLLRGKTREGGDFTAIPYQLWGNRGQSQMTVWLST